jgi:ribonuclease Z
MRPLFHPQLVNGPLGDPALYVDCLYQNRALLFDAGELSGYPPGKLLKVTHLFVSHAHMDHIIGFDHLVRLMLGRQKRLRVFGPAPIVDQVISRLASYSWNLVQEYGERLILELTQLRDDSLERVSLDCREGFHDPGSREVEPFDGWICRETTFGIRAAVLDHKIPSIGFCLEEPRHVQILKGRLEPMGLRPGRWLRDLREAVLREDDGERALEVAPQCRGPLPLGLLQERLVRFCPGQRIGYVVDAGFSEMNRQRILGLVKEANVLFIEAPFLQEDSGRAQMTSHLTAFQAGRLAAEACVKRVVPFHFSPKYASHPERLLAEVNEGFRSLPHALLSHDPQSAPATGNP